MKASLKLSLEKLRTRVIDNQRCQMSDLNHCWYTISHWSLEYQTSAQELMVGVLDMHLGLPFVAHISFLIQHTRWIGRLQNFRKDLHNLSTRVNGTLSKLSTSQTETNWNYMFLIRMNMHQKLDNEVIQGINSLSLSDKSWFNTQILSNSCITLNLNV